MQVVLYIYCIVIFLCKFCFICNYTLWAHVVFRKAFVPNKCCGFFLGKFEFLFVQDVGQYLSYWSTNDVLYVAIHVMRNHYYGG